MQLNAIMLKNVFTGLKRAGCGRAEGEVVTRRGGEQISRNAFVRGVCLPFPKIKYVGINLKCVLKLKLDCGSGGVAVGRCGIGGVVERMRGTRVVGVGGLEEGEWGDVVIPSGGLFPGEANEVFGRVP